MSRGRLLTIEGVEGVGKSTNIDFILAQLGAAGIPYIKTREPGGTTIGESLREILLDTSVNDMSAMTELLLMFASRCQHVEGVIEPALRGGTWVVCDRFTDSSYAYQGAGRGLGTGAVAAVEKAALGSFCADHTLILDLPVQVGLERAGQRGEADRFEVESHAFFNRVRQGFLDRAKGNDRYHVVDAGKPLTEVQADIALWLQQKVLVDG